MGVHLVTGVGGFVGSHLAEQLLAMGHRVRGVDCITPYYADAAKRANLSGLLQSPAFEMVEDLRIGDAGALLDDVSMVSHEAAQPGVCIWWADQSGEYSTCNIDATQRLRRCAAPRCATSPSTGLANGRTWPPTA